MRVSTSRLLELYAGMLCWLSLADLVGALAYVLSEAARQHSAVTQALQWAAPNFCLPVSWMLD